ncbi:MAG TPA: dephospho-CoA kinase [Rhodocyclaceae bacterium]
MSGAVKPAGLVVGLTGGIGSGKSAAASAFARLGAPVVDADACAHRLTAAGGAAMPALTAAFGSVIATADGALDRAAMRARTFADPSVRSQLEALLHPLIRAACEAEVAAALGAGAAYVIWAVPLLVEKGDWRGRMQRVLVVDCPEDLQIARVQARSGLPAEEVARIMAAQATRAERLAAADDVIDNSGTLAELAGQVAALDRKYRDLAANPGGFPPYSG